MTIITTDRFVMRPFEKQDAMALSVLINSKTIAKFTTISLPWSIDFTAWWIDFVAKAMKKMPVTEYHFAVMVDNKLVGAIGIINIDDHRGELGYWLGDDYAGKGLMTAIVKEMVAFGFEKLGLTRIFAPVLPYNKGSMRVLEKNEFEHEGVFRKHFHKNKRFFDAHIYAKIK